MTTLLLWFVLAAPAQQPPDVRTLFESGAHDQVVEAVAAMPSPSPSDTFAAALSHQRLSNDAAARQAFERLAAMDASSAWHLIGGSALKLAEGDHGEALALAVKATETGGAQAQAHYQHGLVLAATQDFNAAAAAFERALESRPRWAYAHYYAGLAYSRFKRIDKMATHFEAFLTLAPDAPERAEVESIMRTVRGR